MLIGIDPFSTAVTISFALILPPRATPTFAIVIELCSSLLTGIDLLSTASIILCAEIVPPRAILSPAIVIELCSSLLTGIDPSSIPDTISSELGILTVDQCRLSASVYLRNWFSAEGAKGIV